MVTFDSQEGALRAAAHFHGCQWDAGAAVSARLLPAAEELSPAAGRRRKSARQKRPLHGPGPQQPAARALACDAEAALATAQALSSDAPAFVPKQAAASVADMKVVVAGKLAAAGEAGAIRAGTSHKAVGSDTSTEIGSESDKDASAVLA